MRFPFRIGKAGPSRHAADEPVEIIPRTSLQAPSAPSRAELEQAEVRVREIEAERDALAGRLAQLETMLADPESGQNAILYYRLRALWDMSRHNLELMAGRFREKYEAQSQIDNAAGLPLDKRRAINILLIAMAQEYYLAYREDQIAEMARLAAQKPVEEIHFGLADECLEFGRKVRELVARARGESHLSEFLRRRAKYLHGRLHFDEDVTVPRAESLNALPSRIADAGDSLNDYSESIPVNVLALNYWNVTEVLLR